MDRVMIKLTLNTELKLWGDNEGKVIVRGWKAPILMKARSFSYVMAGSC